MVGLWSAGIRNSRILRSGVAWSESWCPRTSSSLIGCRQRCYAKMAVRSRLRETYMQGVETKKELTSEQREELLMALKARFEKNMNRHQGLEWAKVQARLEADPEKLWSLYEMERTGGEPDVVGHDKKTGEYIFYDCSAESPKGRRSLCYDREALESRKENKPDSSATDMAAAIGIEL